AVVDRALQRKEEPPTLDLESIRAFAAQLRKRNPDMHALRVEIPSVRQRLFQEAVHGSELVRLAAREGLKAVVGSGFDGPDPPFLAEETLPGFGSVGPYLLGFPDDVARPPYVRQARRMLARFAALRAQIDHSDPAWFESFWAALRVFNQEGTLPEDELL